MITKLTQQERHFINKFKEAEDQGFSEQWGVSLATEECKKDMLYMFEDCESFEKIVADSILLFSACQGIYISKYGDFFWATGDEGEIYCAGKHIQNSVYPALADALWPFELPFTDFYDENDKHFNHYPECVEQYKKFCKDAGLPFIDNFDDTPEEAAFTDFLNQQVYHEM